MNSSGMQLDENTPWETVNSFLKPYTVKTGSDCINKQHESLFKVIVVKIYDEPHDKKQTSAVKSILVIFLSHVLGDGHTFYRLYSFLDQQVKIESLIAIRLMDFPDRIDEMVGKVFNNIYNHFRSYFRFINDSVFFKTKCCYVIY
jgi:hypothetical protein